MTDSFSYRRDIQGLRAFAVLAVVLFHFFPSWLPGGFVGVDVFFVISGYLISTIILKGVAAGSFRISEFYSRRIRRIFPALILVLLTSIIYGWYFVLPSDYFELGKQLLGATLFASNIFFYFDSGYFAGQQSNLPLLHLWSLGVEEQFYLIFPILCIWLAPAGPWRMGYVFGAIAILSLGIDLVFLPGDSSFSFYMPVARFWEFFFGIYIALANLYFESSLKRLNSLRRISEIQSIVGILMLIISVRLIKPSFLFPGLWPVLPCMGAALIILAPPTSHMNRLALSSGPSVFLGSISYPLYLWHWPILIFAKQLTYQDNFHLGIKIGLLVFALLLATLTYELIERPIARIKNKIRRKNMIRALCAAMVVVGIFGSSSIYASGFNMRFGPEVAALDHNYSNDLTDRWNKECFAGPYFNGKCDNISSVKVPAHSIFIWGDSHAADLMPGLMTTLEDSNIRVSMFTSSLCPPVLNYDERYRPDCRSTNDFIFKRLAALKPEIVVLSALWTLQPADYAKLHTTILGIKAAGAKEVVVIGPAPQWKIPAVGLLERELRKDPDSEPPDYQPNSDLDLSSMEESDLEITALSAGAHYISLTSFLCQNNGCLVKTGPGWQGVVTFDTGHFTVHGSELVAQQILPIILR